MSKQIQDLSVQELRQEIKRRIDKGNEPHGILVLKMNQTKVFDNYINANTLRDILNKAKEAVNAKEALILTPGDEIFLITDEGIVKPEDKGLKITIEREEPKDA